jgi:hypothetical protein
MTTLDEALDQASHPRPAKPAPAPSRSGRTRETGVIRL